MNLLFKTNEFTLGEYPALRLTRPSNPDDVLNTVTDEQYEKDQFLPYWAELWPSSTALASYLHQTRPEKPLRVLEMGSGIGHLSAILCASGHRVTASDISPIACRYALHNMLSNGTHGNALSFDWRTPPFKRNFADLIIASDVLYESRWIQPVLSCIRSTLAATGIALLADPCRTHWNKFKEEALEADFEVELKRIEEMNGGKTRIEIVELRMGS